MFKQDLKYVLRSLRKSPGFSSIAIVVLALGIGSNLAVFSLIDALFLRPLPVEKPDTLVQISTFDKDGRSGGIFSKILEPLRAETAFRGICGYAAAMLPVELNGSVRGASVLTMSGDCFATLGVRTQIGRPFSMSDEAPGAARVAVLTDSLWRSTFAGSKTVLGQKIQIGGTIFSIIGVAEPRFAGFSMGFPSEVIIPLRQRPSDVVSAENLPVYYWVDILARRAEGISLRQAQARMSVLEKQLLAGSVPRRYNQSQKQDYLARRIAVATLRSGAEAHLKERFGDPLYAIFGICASVLLIACANLTSLLLARGLQRQREIAVRLALGAGRKSIVRLMAIESSVLVLAGAAAGVLLADWARQLVAAQAGKLFSIGPDPALDGRTAMFFAGMVLLVAIALAAAPAWQAGRTHRAIAWNAGGRGVIGSNTRNQKMLLVAQVALTLALVSGSGFFTSSMKHLNELNLGLKPQGACEAQLALLSGSYRDTTPGTYYRELLQDVEAIPGVSSASLSTFAPFWTGTYLEPVAGIENSEARSDIRANAVLVTDRFFETLGVPMLEGAGFRASDSEASEPSAIVSQSLANLLGGSQVIGQHIRVGEAGPYQRLKVTGIAANVQLSLQDPSDTRPPAVYINLWQHPEQRYRVLLVKSTGSGPVSAAVLSRVVQSRGREYVARYSTLEAQRDDALIENRWLAYLSGAFGILALILAATGLFGLLSYHVASRTSEIGIRMALGAERLEIHRLVLRELFPVMAAGVLAGLGLTLASGKVVAGLVYGVGIRDPRLLGVSVAVLILTAILAAWIPARRASSVDPLVALRNE